MTTNTTETNTAEVSQEESFADYEARLASGNGSSDVDEPVEDSDDKTVSDSETEDDTAQESDEDESKQQDEQKPKGKGGFQRKIDKLTAKIHDLESKLANPADGSTTEKGKTEPETPTFAQPEPQLEDFDSMGDYTKALLAWDRAKVAFETTETAKREATDKEVQTLIEGWKSRVSDAKKAHPDYDGVMDKAKDIKIGPSHQRLFIKSEVGAEVAYQLAKDTTELQKFAEMDPLDAARYFGRLESKVTPAKTATSSRAPRPPAQVGSSRGSAPADPTHDDGNDFAAWEAKRNAQLRRQRGR